MNTENHYQETDLGNISLNPRGEYNPEESYEYLDLVVLEGGSYVCLAENGATITGISPESGKTTQYWQVITIPGSLTPEYIAMHDRVVNLSEQVEADAEEVRTAEQNVSGMELNVTQMQEQTRQSAEAAEQSKDSSAGYAASADASRQAAEESKQNIDAQVTGFDSHVAEKTEEAENDIEAARIAANKAIIAQQEQSVNEVARAGIEAISTAQSAAQTATEKAQAADTSEKNAAASETAAKLSETNATKMAEQVAADKEQVANDRTAVENAKQEMTGSVAQIEQNTQGISELKSEININAYKDVGDYQRIVDGEAETSLIDSMMTALSYVERRSSHTTKTININTVGGHREILRLHKRQGTDYQALETDVFLPDAADDFSDVRITDQNGNALPYDVLYSGDIDVIPDQNLPINPSGKIFQNSNGDWITYKSSSGISKSSDYGKTWQKIGSLPTKSSIVCFVTSDDVIFFFHEGVLRRSAPPYTSYETVLNFSDRTNPYILSTNMVEYSTGVLFVAAYQTAWNIEIYKSVDNGLTWTMSYSDPSGKYHHVHAMYIDRTQTPNAIYAGCNGGGGVLKSVDGGATWVDLRELHPSMPRSTDYGVIYADSDYRFLGGETAIVGGNSILRTSDDANFEKILHIGNSVYSIAKNGNKLYGGLVCSGAYRQGGIIMSEDGGATWQNIYTTYHYQSDSASDGGRYVDVLDGQVVVGMQDAEGIRPSVRVYPSGHYAEILVDIPIGTTSIIVSDGYACGKRAKMYNDYSLGLPEMVSFNFNENTDVVKESISGKVYGGQYTFVDGGRHIGNTYPYIHKPSDAKMISLGDGFGGFLVDGLSFADVAGITVSFWGICRMWETVVISSPTKTNKLSVLNNALGFLGKNVDGSFNYPITDDSINHYVISIDFTNNIVKGYKNGALRSDMTGNSYVATWINNMKTATSVLFFPSKAIVQHFQLFNGIATDDDIKRMYLAGINA